MTWGFGVAVIGDADSALNFATGDADSAVETVIGDAESAVKFDMAAISSQWRAARAHTPQDTARARSARSLG